MANYFDQFEVIEENKPQNKSNSYWDQFESVEPEQQQNNDPYNLDFNDNKPTFTESHPMLASIPGKVGNAFNNVSNAIQTGLNKYGEAQALNGQVLNQNNDILSGGIQKIAQPIQNTYDQIANKPINLMPSRLLQPVTNAFSGVGQVASNVLPFAMGGYYNSPTDVISDVKREYNRGVDLAKQERQLKEMNPTQLAESLVDMYLIGKMMPGNNATMLGRIGTAGKVGGVYGGLESLKENGLNPVQNLKDASRDALTFMALEPLAELGVKAINEGVERINPSNYKQIIESVPKNKGMGMSQRTVYEPKVKYEYKPQQNVYSMKDALGKPRIETGNISNSTDFTLGEGQELKYGITKPIKQAEKKTVVNYLAPNIAAKQANLKAEKTNQIADTSKIVNSNEEKIAKLESKIQMVGKDTMLGKKYQAQIDELRGTVQPSEQVSEQVKQEIISQDYKDSVKEYTQEQHKNAVETYGNKMADAAKKANAGIGKDDNGQQYNENKQKFEEYKALKDYHEEQIKPQEIDFNKINNGAIWKNETWGNIFNKLKEKNDTNKYWIEKVNKSGDSLLSDDVFSHYQLKSEEGYKVKIPSEYNEYIKNTFNDDKYIGTVKPQEATVSKTENVANLEDLDIKKGVETLKSGKEKEFDYVTEVPQGWTKIEGAMTAPRGYTWYSNNKPYLGKQRKSILVKDEVTNEESSVVENNEVEKLAKEYSTMLGQNEVRDFHRDFANALINKNADSIINIVAQGRGMNENSKKLFTKYTGIKLPSTIQGKKDAINAWANGKTLEIKEKNNKPTHKYKVKVLKSGTVDGLYAEIVDDKGQPFAHTDGNSMWLTEYVNADTSKVEKINKTVTYSAAKALLKDPEKYTKKLKDIGKAYESGKDKIRVLEYEEDGGTRYLFVNDKYLLNKKDLELYGNDEYTSVKAISVRKDGKQIGIVMPVLNKSIEPKTFIDIPKIEFTKKTDSVKEVKPKETKPKETKKESTKLQDSGEFLQGNRKLDTSLTWNDLEGMNDLIRAKNTTKAKVYPKPNIEDLKNEGFNEFQAGIIQNVYNKINAKPAAGYEGKENQKLYVDTINDVMKTIKSYIKDHSDEFSTDLIAEAAKNYRNWSYNYNKSLFDAVFPDTENKVGQYGNVFRHYKDYNRKALIIGGNKFTGALQLDSSTLRDVVKTIEESKKVKETGEKVKKENWEKEFTVLEPDKWNKQYAVANRRGSNILAKYDTKEEAINAAKRVYDRMQQLKAQNKKDNFERDYIERRENNKDVTAEDIQNAFGFRGVNFGNWATAKERQDFANFAYDSLYDLAELLNLPPKALSLNGQLGLAYGAQGHGGKAAAHYIPAYKEINLTKEYGAGSLAHEWWHALDNEFGNKSTGKEFSQEWALSLRDKGELRQELFDELKNLQKQIKETPFTEEDVKKNAENLTARCERNIKFYADTVKSDYSRAKNADELNSFIDDLVNNREKYKTYTFEQMQELENNFFKMLPENRDTITNRGRFSWITSEIRRLGRVDELAKSGANKSEYLKNAIKLDENSGKKYWSEDTELGARAFSSYLLDKMEKQSILNHFLVREEGGVLNMKAFRELAEGEERESLVIPTHPKNPAERERIFNAFDKLFDTIKTRETDKGVELYSKYGDDKKDLEEFYEYMNSHNLPMDQDYLFYQRELEPDNVKIKKIITLGKLVQHPAYRYLAKDIKGIENVPIYMASKEMIMKGDGLAYYSPKDNIIVITPNLPPWMLEHEILHASDAKILNKTVKGREQLAIAGKVNDAYNIAYDKNKNNPNIINKIILKYRNFKYRNCKIEKRGYNKQKEAFNNYERRRNQSIRRQIYGTNARGYKYFIPEEGSSWSNIQGSKGFFSTKIQGNRKTSGRGSEKDNIGDLGENSQSISKKIEQSVRDKVYEWHGSIGKDRYDVDKTLNSFTRMSKSIAKELSSKIGVKFNDKQLRELLPFLRERTEVPEALGRKDLSKIYSKLSKEDITRLTKFADDISEKFEKYYKNYQEAKGQIDDVAIENHISHIWDLDDKKKSLLTNYITTNSRFAKQRTIETLAKGINGIEIDGELVKFKPKTLDYAEILKTSSDNLIKATHDSQLANVIKNMKGEDKKPLVLPSSKAPSDWVEVSHPALNKAVYMGAVGEDELPMLMKSSVKVHPSIANYTKAIFETPKQDNKFWRGYDAINGMLKQSQLGFSGFHGLALTESEVANVGVIKTLKATNIKNMYDAVKNGKYDVYEKEPEAKRAIEAGVQLGTPSDLNRNLVEETLGKIPVIGKYLQGAVSINNKILWDVLHNNYKLAAFNTAIENLGKDVTKEQERAIAQWVNDSFGGQAWELLGIKQSSVKKAGRLLLSPDWNFSTLRQALGSANFKALDSWLNNPNTNKDVKRIAEMLGVNENIGSKGARGKVARGFWIKAVIYSTVFYNLLNAMFREKDRKENPKLYPKNMTPYDYSIWANSNPTDNWYEKMMPYVFIGRNKDNTARMLRVGKQFREVPEFLAEPVTKLGGKSASILGVISQVAVGMSPADVIKKVTGKEAYLNQDIWNGYGENAKMKDGMDAVTGRLKTIGKSAAPFVASKYIGGKHEFSGWDLFAQTSSATSKGKVYRQTTEALKSGHSEKINDIKRKAYQDGLDKKQINKMVGYATKNWKSENTATYKPQFVKALEKHDKNELDRINNKMKNHNIPGEERRRIYEKAYKDYMKNN